MYMYVHVTVIASAAQKSPTVDTIAQLTAGLITYFKNIFEKQTSV